MTPLEAFYSLEIRGYKFVLKDGQLSMEWAGQTEAPPVEQTSELREIVRANKEEIIDHLERLVSSLLTLALRPIRCAMWTVACWYDELLPKLPVVQRAIAKKRIHADPILVKLEAAMDAQALLAMSEEPGPARTVAMGRVDEAARAYVKFALKILGSSWDGTWFVPPVPTDHPYWKDHPHPYLREKEDILRDLRGEPGLPPS